MNSIPKTAAVAPSLPPDAAKSSPVRHSNLQHDLPWHKGEHPMESWHFATNLRGDGRHYSFRVHLVIVETHEEEPQASIGLCLVDQDTGWIRESETTVPLSDIVIRSDVLQISSRALDIRCKDTEMSLSAELPDAFVELSGKVGTPILINNGEGSISFFGAQQYKFAFPGIQVSGAVSIMGKRQTVTGAMWFNRQWGELPRRFRLDRNLEHRQWICLYPSLSNGVSLSASQVWDFRTSRVETNCTVVLPDGTHVVEKIQPLELSDYVDSRRSDRRYPRHVILSDPALETCLQISLPYQEREVVSKMGGMIKFDGKMVVDGFIFGDRVTGDGFVEMVGRWR
nr:lipocalin-like domain-containing protein [uncultured Cohaesibacter sp.]